MLFPETKRKNRRFELFESTIVYGSAILLGTFISSVTQVVLKKESAKKKDSIFQEYLNGPVIISYVIFALTTLLSVFAYKGIPLSAGPILEATSYFYITFFGVKIFKEKLTLRKCISLGLIICGIVVYALQ